jgi:hypothetical protein
VAVNELRRPEKVPHSGATAKSHKKDNINYTLVLNYFKRALARYQQTIQVAGDVN